MQWYERDETEKTESGGVLYAFDDYQLDTQCYELRHGGALCALERQGFNVLVYLVQHRDRVVTKG